MEHWQKVRVAAHMQGYIAAHITEPITLADLARGAGYSPWHAARIFREITGRTPFDYIRTLRLSKAVERLRDGSGRVVDVAFDFVFGSHEGFAGVHPAVWGDSPAFRVGTVAVSAVHAAQGP